jgi:hypothetical protein
MFQGHFLHAIIHKDLNYQTTRNSSTNILSLWTLTLTTATTALNFDMMCAILILKLISVKQDEDEVVKTTEYFTQSPQRKNVGTAVSCSLVIQVLVYYCMYVSLLYLMLYNLQNVLL